MLCRVLAAILFADITTRALAGTFTVELRNRTEHKVRVWTVRFSGTPPVTLNNGKGLNLNTSGQNGDTKSAIYSEGGVRAIIFWSAATGELLAASSETVDNDLNAFVTSRNPTEPEKFLIAVGR